MSRTVTTFRSCFHVLRQYPLQFSYEKKTHGKTESGISFTVALRPHETNVQARLARAGGNVPTKKVSGLLVAARGDIRFRSTSPSRSVPAASAYLHPQHSHSRQKKNEKTFSVSSSLSGKDAYTLLYGRERRRLVVHRHPRRRVRQEALLHLHTARQRSSSIYGPLPLHITVHLQELQRHHRPWIQSDKTPLADFTVR